MAKTATNSLSMTLTPTWRGSSASGTAISSLLAGLTPDLEVEGGHIGYDVRPSSRRLGFGTTALRLALREASGIGLSRVRITVDADNLPSVKIIERNGGILSGQAISEKSGKPIKQYWLGAP
jgi:predicted acetyltransferase